MPCLTGCFLSCVRGVVWQTLTTVYATPTTERLEQLVSATTLLVQQPTLATPVCVILAAGGMLPLKPVKVGALNVSVPH